jgi:hypothetical protein
MSWYTYIFSFLSGMFFINALPHFVYGICGDRFPTPFAHPPGKGLSSSTVNVLWAPLNLVVGYTLFRIGKVSSGDDLTFAIVFTGVAAMSIMGSVIFRQKDVE